MRLHNPPLKLTTEILSFLYECNRRNKKCTEKDIHLYFNKTESYERKGIEFLITSNLIKEEEGFYCIQESLISKLDDTIQKSTEFVKKILIDNKPFVEYTYFVSKGKRPADSIKLVKSIYDIEQSEKTIKEVFDNWIKFLGINVKQKTIQNETLQKIEESINNKLLVNKFLKHEFEDYYNIISKDVLNDLSCAIMSVKDDSGQAVNDAGRALEDFLRIDLAKEIDLSKCSGIIQITNELNKYKEFPTKLNNISASLGNIRSMGKAHGVDLKLKERWYITETSAIAYIILVISLMKSYLERKISNKLVF